MNKFIEEITGHITRLAPKYGITCPTAVVAQACVESAYGTSTKAKHHNYFGLKYKPGRCPSASGAFTDSSSEQRPDGSYMRIRTQWFGFKTMEDGVKGYFEFISARQYKNLKGVTDPLTYLSLIRRDGYATSLKYVSTCMAVVKKLEAEKLDIKVNKKSVLHNTTHRTGAIRYIVLHYTGAEGGAKANVSYFNLPSTRSASADFFVDHSGEIWQYNPDPATRYSWAVGGGRQSKYGGKYFGQCKNSNSVSIEMCCHNSKSGWYIESATVKAAQELTKYLMGKYGIDAAHVIRHYDVNGKYCPGVKGWIAPLGGGEKLWDSFKAGLTGKSPAKEESKVVEALQAALNAAYGLKLAEDNSYGPKTRAAVKAHYLYYRADKPIVNAHVSWLQGMLKSAGYKITVDGSYGPATEEVVKSYQKDHGLTVDGYAGLGTHDSLIG